MSNKVFYVMGVSGCGKSSISEELSSYLSCSYIDSDDIHPKQNVDKMRKGIPLTDEDRTPWLVSINSLATECILKKKSLVIASSCLKPMYRNMLQQGIENDVVFIYLKGSFDVINDRMNSREGHYFSGEAMLKSQFNTLIEPNSDEAINYIEVDIDKLDIKAATIEIIQKLEPYIHTSSSIQALTL